MSSSSIFGDLETFESSNTLLYGFGTIKANRHIELRGLGSTATTTTISSLQTSNKHVVLPNFSATSDSLLSSTSSDIMFNKTITDSSNIVHCDAFKTSTGFITISAAAPTGAGQVLETTGSDTAVWATPGAGPTTTLTSAGGTVSLVNDGTGPTLATKGLTAGARITLTDNGTDIDIIATNTTLTSAGGTQTLVNDGIGPALATKGLTAGTAISLGSTATAVVITGAYTAGTGIDITGASISNTGVTSLAAGTGLSVSAATGAVTVSNTSIGFSAQLTAVTASIAVGGVITGTWSNNFLNTGTFSGGLYTIPQTGKWLINFSAGSLTTDSNVTLRQNGTTNIMNANIQAAGSALQSMGSRVYTLTAGNTIGMYNSAAAARVYEFAFNTIAPVTWISAFWLGP
jgi:hypothetical protein